MPQIPLVLDTNDTERSRADNMLRSLGLTQAILAARAANRPDVSANLVGIGPSAPSQNPMAIGSTPAPSFQQPNPAPTATVAVPPGNFNPMKVTASGNYQQPNTGNPKPNPSGTVSAKNPMGL